MRCPVCTTELKIAERQGVEIDYCPKCRGVWLDRGELDKIIERAAATEQRGQQDVRPVAPSMPPDYPDDRRFNEDDYDDRRRYPPGHKKKSFLGEMFDIFD